MQVPEAPPHAQVGERYHLVKLLGHGSFSSVCLAVDSYTGDKVFLHATTNLGHALQPLLLPNSQPAIVL